MFKAMGTVTGVEFSMIRRDGTELIASFDGRIGRKPDGSFKQTHCVLHNITERKRAEQVLRESEERYRTIVELTEEGVRILDSNNLTTFTNGKLTNKLGYEQKEMIGSHPSVFVHPDDRDSLSKHLENRRQSHNALYETRLLSKDGRCRNVLISARPLIKEDGIYVGDLAMFTDITEKKQLEERLLRIHKMESIGRLAGGVAHDFNNLLTVIMGYSDIACSETMGNENLNNYLVNIKAVSERGAGLTQQLLAFAQQQRIVPKRDI